MILGNAFRFCSFDKETNTFYVHGNLVENEDVGTYPIQVYARFFNETFTETYKEEFTLTVWNIAQEIEIEGWFPSNPIYYPEWNPEHIVRVNTTEEVDDPDSPIPYIMDLTADGICIIAWDRDMQPPEDYSVIPPTLIAVEQGMNLESYRF